MGQKLGVWGQALGTRSQEFEIAAKLVEYSLKDCQL